MWENPSFVQAEGQWLALSDGEVIAIGETYEDVLDEAFVPENKK